MSAAALREAGALRVGFAGTPEFAAVALRALQAAGFTLPLVLSQPDRPAGRGLRLSPSPVKSQALVWGLSVAQPRSLRLEGKFPEDALAAQLALSEARLDVLVVAAYGLILPAWVLQTPRLGCLNIHASLLPRWRGAAPIHRAIEAGDAQTGITVMQMDEGLDTGAMLAWRATAIGPQETTGQLHDRLAALGGEMIVETLRQAGLSALPQAVPQPLEGVCYAHKVDKAEAAIDWRWSAERIARRVRAFDPFPGASFECAGETVKLWSARSLPGRDEAAGTVLSAPDEPLVVACGDGALALDVLQRPGGKRLPAAAFLQARPGLMGQILPIPAPDH